MISFSVSFRAFLLSQAGITALVDQRVHLDELPEANQRRLPAIVYTMIDSDQLFTHDSPVPLRHSRIQIDAWANRGLEAEAVSEEMIKALVGYRGPMGDLEYTAGWHLDRLTNLAEEETNLKRVSIDVMGWYRPQEEEES